MADCQNRIRFVECSGCCAGNEIICEACGGIDNATMHTTESLEFYENPGRVNFWHCHNCDMWTLTQITDDTSFTCGECKSSKSGRRRMSWESPTTAPLDSDS